MPRKIHLTIRCECCDSKKVSIETDSTFSITQKCSFTGGIIGGLIAGIPGAIAGALLGGKTTACMDVSAQYECADCGHSSDSCAIKNDEGESLDEYELKSLLEDMEEDDEVFFSAYIEKDSKSDT